jgi:hypothetical protein
MQRSIYLAKLIGPVFITMGLGLLLNGAIFRALIGQFLQGYAFIYLSGLLALPVGIALILAHNVWTPDWRVIVTIVGWLAAIGGVIRIMLPQVVQTIGTAVFSHPEVPIVAGFAVLVLGGVLSYFGYADMIENKSRGRAPRARKRSRR